jgi:hypothetical protein
VRVWEPAVDEASAQRTANSIALDILGRHGDREGITTAAEFRTILLGQARQLRHAYIQLAPDEEPHLPQLTSSIKSVSNLRNMVRMVEYLTGEQMADGPK